MKIKQIYLTILILSFSYFNGYSQDILLKGIVYDNFKKPLKNAGITIKNKGLYDEDTIKYITYSDTSGYFNINCKKGQLLYVNYKNELVYSTHVIYDTITIFLHEAKEIAWDGFFIRENRNIFIYSNCYNSIFNFSIDYLFSLDHNKKYMEIFDFGLKIPIIINNFSEPYIVPYIDFSLPKHESEILKYLYPYVDLGYYLKLGEKNKINNNFYTCIGLSSMKKYVFTVKYSNKYYVQLVFNYNCYLNDKNANSFTVGVKLGSTNAYMIGGTEYY